MGNKHKNDKNKKILCIAKKIKPMRIEVAPFQNRILEMSVTTKNQQVLRIAYHYALAQYEKLLVKNHVHLFCYIDNGDVMKGAHASMDKDKLPSNSPLIPFVEKIKNTGETLVCIYISDEEHIFAAVKLS